jgi:hypothetical protein
MRKLRFHVFVSDLAESSGLTCCERQAAPTGKTARCKSAQQG